MVAVVTANHPFDDGQQIAVSIAAGIRLRTHRQEIDRYRRCCRGIACKIITVATIKVIGPAAAIQSVIAGIAGKRIVTGQAANHVIAVKCINRIIVRVAGYMIGSTGRAGRDKGKIRSS